MRAAASILSCAILIVCGPRSLAAEYGITAIPTGILVGRDGKVVSLEGRGKELTRLLERLFPEPSKNGSHGQPDAEIPESAEASP